MARQRPGDTWCMVCLSAASWCDDCNLSHVTAERDALRAEVAALKAAALAVAVTLDDDIRAGIRRSHDSASGAVGYLTGSMAVARDALRAEQVNAPVSESDTFDEADESSDG